MTAPNITLEPMSRRNRQISCLEEPHSTWHGPLSNLSVWTDIGSCTFRPKWSSVNLKVSRSPVFGYTQFSTTFIWSCEVSEATKKWVWAKVRKCRRPRHKTPTHPASWPQVRAHGFAGCPLYDCSGLCLQHIHQRLGISQTDTAIRILRCCRWRSFAVVEVALQDRTSGSNGTQPLI